MMNKDISEEEKIIKIIANICLTHRDSGEASVNREARLIINGLKEKNFAIVKQVIENDKIIHSDICHKCNGEGQLFPVYNDSEPIECYICNRRGKK